MGRQKAKLKGFLNGCGLQHFLVAYQADEVHWPELVGGGLRVRILFDHAKHLFVGARQAVLAAWP